MTVCMYRDIHTTTLYYLCLLFSYSTMATCDRTLSTDYFRFLILSMFLNILYTLKLSN